MNQQDLYDYVMRTPYNTNPTILEQKIKEISGGGGGSGGSGGAKFTYGTYTPVSSSGTGPISHGLGETPNLFLWFLREPANSDTDLHDHGSGGKYYRTNTSSYYVCGGYMKGMSFVVGYTSDDKGIKYVIYENNLDKYDRKVITINSSSVGSQTGYLAGMLEGSTVFWVAGVVE